MDAAEAKRNAVAGDRRPLCGPTQEIGAANVELELVLTIVEQIDSELRMHHDSLSLARLTLRNL